MLGALAALAVVAVVAVAFRIYHPAKPIPASGDGQPVSPAAATDPPVLPTGPGWHLSFDARFTGSSLDTSVWATCYPWADVRTGCTNYGNTEYQWFLPSQDRISGGSLHLVAEPVATSGRTAQGKPEEYSCRSGMVTTYPSFRFEYGVVQVVARIPSTGGLWSGLWLAAANLKWPPEIDILEYWGQPVDYTGLYLHPVTGPRVVAHPATGNLAAGWHTFTLYWTPDELAWFIDGRADLYTSQHVPHQMMYFIADLADYRLHQADGCDGSLLIRSVKVWQARSG
jgi:beta-glucanase (GH16 family)